MPDSPVGQGGATVETPRRWNGYGLSWWRCLSCGAARRVTGLCVAADGALIGVKSDPCKRCGSEHEPQCLGDPFGGY
jgi:hypothetical protein